MTDLHHPSIHDYAHPVDSFWEASAGAPVAGAEALTEDVTAEIAVIGAGFTGLNAALTLARDHGRSVVVLDAGRIGWGASGRNGGFCCPGSHKLPWSILIRRFGLDEAKAFFAVQREAIDYVRALLTDEGIDADQGVIGDAMIAHHPRAAVKLAAEKAMMSETFGVACELLPKSALRERGFVTAEAQAALIEQIGFALHPLKYVRGLARLAQRHGVRLHGRSEVVDWTREGAVHVLRTAQGTSLRARQVVVATAGFTRDRLHPDLTGKVLPVLTNIITSRPLTLAEREAQGWTSDLMSFDTRNLLHYFRLLPDGRMLFGARGGISAGPQATARMRAQLMADFKRFFPAWAHVEFTHYWRGLTDLSADLLPHVGQLDGDGSVHYALCYHGNGVAMGSWCGRSIGAQVAGNRPPLPAPMVAPFRRFPLPALRSSYLAAIYLGAGIKDRLGGK